MTLVDPSTGEVVVDHQVMPAMTQAARAALRASIVKFGVLVPVAFDQHGNIIDGHNRVAIAEELGVSYEHTTHVVRDHEHAVELAATLNLDRRHMDEATRAQIARSLRNEGHGLRAIGDALGVGKSTIERDLNEPPEADPDYQVSQDGTPDSDTECATDAETEHTIGSDGKKYPRRPNKWTDEALHDLLENYNAGLSQQTLADMHGVSQAAISGLLSKARELAGADIFTIESPPRGDDKSRQALAARRRLVAEMAGAGLSTRQMVDTLNVGRETIAGIVKDLGIEVRADDVIRKTRHIDPNRVVSETVSTLEGAVFGLTLVDPGDVDPAQVAAWAESLRSSIKSLNRFLKELTR